MDGFNPNLEADIKALHAYIDATMFKAWEAYCREDDERWKNSILWGHFVLDSELAESQARYPNGQPTNIRGFLQ